MTRCSACHEDVIVAVSSAGDRLVLDCEPQPDGEWVVDYANRREPTWFARRWQQLLPEARFLRGRPSRYRLHRQECWAFVVRVKSTATFAVKLCLLCLLLVGCTAAGSLGPNITLTGDRGPLDMLRSGPGADGEATIRIEAGDDVGYYVAAWRNKSAPNLNTNLNGPLTPAPAKP